MVFENRLQSYCKCTEKTKFQKHKNPTPNFSASRTLFTTLPLLLYIYPQKNETADTLSCASTVSD